MLWPFFDIAVRAPVLKMMFFLRYFSWVSLAGAAIAGFELDRLCADSLARRKSSFAFLAVLAGLAGCAIAVYGHFRPLHAAAGGLESLWTSFVVAWICLGAGAALFLAVRARPRASGMTVLSLGLSAIAAAELLHQGMRLYKFGSPQDLYPDTPMLAFVRSRPGPFRVVGEATTLFPNSSIFAGLEDVRTKDPVERLDYIQFLDATCGYPPAEEFKQIRDVNATALDFLNVRYLLSTPGRAPPAEKWRLVYSAGDGTVFENRDVLPRVYAPERITLVAGVEERLGWSGNAFAGFGVPASAIAGKRDWREHAFVLGREAKVIVNGRPGSPDTANPRMKLLSARAFRTAPPERSSSRASRRTGDGRPGTRRAAGSKRLWPTAHSSPFESRAAITIVFLKYSPPGFRTGAGMTAACLLVLAIGSSRRAVSRIRARFSSSAGPLGELASSPGESVDLARGSHGRADRGTVHFQEPAFPVPPRQSRPRLSTLRTPGSPVSGISWRKSATRCPKGPPTHCSRRIRMTRWRSTCSPSGSSTNRWPFPLPTSVLRRLKEARPDTCCPTAVPSRRRTALGCLPRERRRRLRAARPPPMIEGVKFLAAQLALAILGAGAGFHPSVRSMSVASRIAVSLCAGAVALTLEAILFSLAGIPWTVPGLSVPLLSLSALCAARWRRLPFRPHEPLRVRRCGRALVVPGWRRGIDLSRALLELLLGHLDGFPHLLGRQGRAICRQSGDQRGLPARPFCRPCHARIPAAPAHRPGMGLSGGGEDALEDRAHLLRDVVDPLLAHRAGAMPAGSWRRRGRVGDRLLDVGAGDFIGLFLFRRKRRGPIALLRDRGPRLADDRAGAVGVAFRPVDRALRRCPHQGGGIRRGRADCRRHSCCSRTDAGWRGERPARCSSPRCRPRPSAHGSCTRHRGSFPWGSGRAEPGPPSTRTISGALSRRCCNN